MIHWFRFALQVIPLGYVLWRSRAVPLFFLYFVACLGDVLCGEIVFWAFGDSSPVYFWTYAAGTCLICLFALWLTWDSVPSPHRLRKFGIPTVVAVAVCRNVFLEVHHPISSSSMLLLIIAGFLFTCGQITCATALYAPRNHNAVLAMGCLWLFQAVYFWGYLLQSPEWESTGYWLPALITGVMFVLVGCLLPQPKQAYR